MHPGLSQRYGFRQVKLRVKIAPDVFLVTLAAALNASVANYVDVTS